MNIKVMSAKVIFIKVMFIKITFLTITVIYSLINNPLIALDIKASEIYNVETDKNEKVKIDKKVEIDEKVTWSDLVTNMENDCSDIEIDNKIVKDLDIYATYKGLSNAKFKDLQNKNFTVLNNACECGKVKSCKDSCRNIRIGNFRYYEYYEDGENKVAYTNQITFNGKSCATKSVYLTKYIPTTFDKDEKPTNVPQYLDGENAIALNKSFTITNNSYTDTTVNNINADIDANNINADIAVNDLCSDTVTNNLYACTVTSPDIVANNSNYLVAVLSDLCINVAYTCTTESGYEVTMDDSIITVNGTSAGKVTVSDTGKHAMAIVIEVPTIINSSNFCSVLNRVLEICGTNMQSNIIYLQKITNTTQNTIGVFDNNENGPGEDDENIRIAKNQVVVAGKLSSKCAKPRTYIARVDGYDMTTNPIYEIRIGDFGNNTNCNCGCAIPDALCNVPPGHGTVLIDHKNVVPKYVGKSTGSGSSILYTYKPTILRRFECSV